METRCVSTRYGLQIKCSDCTKKDEEIARLQAQSDTNFIVSQETRKRAELAEKKLDIAWQTLANLGGCLENEYEVKEAFAQIRALDKSQDGNTDDLGMRLDGN